MHLRTGPLNYLFMHTGEAGAYCLGVFDNGAAGTLLGGISFRNVLVQYDRRARRVGLGAAACQDIGAAHAPCPPMPGGGAGHEFIEQCAPISRLGSRSMGGGPLRAGALHAGGSRSAWRGGRVATSPSTGACLSVGLLWGFPLCVSLVCGDVWTSRLRAFPGAPRCCGAGR
jgi:hypothetical protein